MLPLSLVNASNVSLANAANTSLFTVVCVLLATAANAAVLTYFGQFLHIEQVSLHHCKNKLVVLDKLARHAVVIRGLLLVLENNYIRQPKGWLPSSSYSHKILKTLKHL